jgi:hypothetical protein
LYRLISKYRKEHKLPKIPLSKSLTLVAKLHSEDLAMNHPDQNECNAHSWSEEGDWSACCYTSDHAQASCMWDKPKELTTYPHPGYEISCAGSMELSANEALQTWKKSQAHNDVVLNKDIWKTPWKAMGIGMFKGYATVWFGHYPEN